MSAASHQQQHKRPPIPLPPSAKSGLPHPHPHPHPPLHPAHLPTSAAESGDSSSSSTGGSPPPAYQGANPILIGLPIGPSSIGGVGGGGTVLQSSLGHNFTYNRRPQSLSAANLVTDRSGFGGAAFGASSVNRPSLSGSDGMAPLSPAAIAAAAAAGGGGSPQRTQSVPFHRPSAAGLDAPLAMSPSPFVTASSQPIAASAAGAHNNGQGNGDSASSLGGTSSSVALDGTVQQVDVAAITAAVVRAHREREGLS